MRADQTGSSSGDQEQSIFELLGLELLPQQEKLRLLEKLEVSAREQVIALILQELQEESYPELDHLLEDEEAKEEDILLFLLEKIPNLQELVNERLGKFKNELVQEVHNIREGLQQLKQQAEDEANSHSSKSNEGRKQQIESLQAEVEQATKEGNFAEIPVLTQKIENLKKSRN